MTNIALPNERPAAAARHNTGLGAAALASGSYGTSHGPNAAASTISTNNAKARPVTGFSPTT